MAYSNNPTVEDLVLTIINDGDGDQCGMSYAERCSAAETGIFAYRTACRAYGRYRNRVYGSSVPNRSDIIEAADILHAYYRQHLLEA